MVFSPLKFRTKNLQLFLQLLYQHWLNFCCPRNSQPTFLALVESSLSSSHLKFQQNNKVQFLFPLEFRYRICSVVANKDSGFLVDLAARATADSYPRIAHRHSSGPVTCTLAMQHRVPQVGSAKCFGILDTTVSRWTRRATALIPSRH